MSFANNQVFGDDVTKTYTSAVYPLGTERLVLGSQTGVGDQAWIFVKNDSGGDYAIGQVVGAKSTTVSLGTTVKAPKGETSWRVIGVAQHVIPTASAADGSSGPYGWVLKRGIGSVLAGTGGIAADKSIVVDTTDDGTAMDAAVLAAATKFDVGIGYAHETKAATNLAQCYVSCRA